MPHNHAPGAAWRRPSRTAPAVSIDGRHMLRSIRDHVDGDGIFAGGDELAASLAGITVNQAHAALAELKRRGFIRFTRNPRDA